MSLEHPLTLVTNVLIEKLIREGKLKSNSTARSYQKAKKPPTKTLQEIDTNVNWQIAKGTPSTTEFPVRKSFEVEIASSKETEAVVVVDSVVATSTDAQEVVP